MIIAMLLYSTYNIVNAIWVAGLGSDALAAVGFISPLFLVIIGLGNGLGAGTTSAIARKIGAGDHAGANNTAVHAILLTVAISALATIPLVLWTEEIALLFGAGKTAGLAGEYGRIIFASTILLLLTNVGSAILRAEGDTKRTMYIMAVSAVMNMILDPLLIYSVGLGIAGACLGYGNFSCFCDTYSYTGFLERKTPLLPYQKNPFITKRKPSGIYLVLVFQQVLNFS